MISDFAMIEELAKVFSSFVYHKNYLCCVPQVRRISSGIFERARLQPCRRRPKNTWALAPEGDNVETDALCREFFCEFTGQHTTLAPTAPCYLLRVSVKLNQSEFDPL